MGCDIHLHIEVKVNGRWEHYAAPHVNRWYLLFEKMAGVRGEIKNAIAPPKGLPEAISAVTRIDFDCWKKNAHSYSWLSAQEIAQLADWLDERGGFEANFDLEHHILHCYFFDNAFSAFSRYFPSRPPEIEDLRFVFWFDN